MSQRHFRPAGANTNANEESLLPLFDISQDIMRGFKPAGDELILAVKRVNADRDFSLLDGCFKLLDTCGDGRPIYATYIETPDGSSLVRYVSSTTLPRH